MAHIHTLTFEAKLPDDEMERAAVLGHPAVKEARAALHKAFKEAGVDHVSVSKIARRKAEGAEPPQAVTLAATAPHHRAAAE